MYSKYGDNAGGSGSMLKEAIARRERNLKPSQVNHLKYLDSM